MSFQVQAFYKSAIATNSEVAFTLQPVGRGFAFVSDATGTPDLGTYVEAEGNKFQALEAFRRIYRELSPRFEMK